MTDPNPPELPGAIARLALIGGTLVSLLAPSMFLTIAYQGEAAQLEAALQSGVGRRDSASGQLHPPRLARGNSGVKSPSPQGLADGLSWLGSETNVRILGPGQQVLLDTHRELPPPLLVRTAKLPQAEKGEKGDRGSWQLELSRSLQPLLLYAVFMLVPGLLFGWMTFLALKAVPMRAFRLALQEIDVRKMTEERLAKSLSIFSATLESTADGIFVTDVAGRAVVANQRFVDLWKLPKAAGAGIAGMESLSSLAEQLRDPGAFLTVQKDLTRHIDVDHGAILELRDGRLFEWNSRPQHIDGKVVGRVSSFRDISERKRAEALLAAEKEVLEMVVCGAPLRDALGVLARHVEVLSGHMFCAVLFREHGEDSAPLCATGPSLPRSLADGIARDGQAALSALFADAGTPRKHGLSDEHSGVIEDIPTLPAWEAYRDLTARLGIQTCFAGSVRASSGVLMGLIVAHYRGPSDQAPHDRELIRVAAHLTSIAIERRQAETRLRVLAHYDALTLLPNRDLFRDRLNQALSHAERHRGRVAVMFLDLDRFKMVNDTLGHDAGDLLLREVSTRLRQCVREEDTVARLGGDEFTVILEITRAEDAALVAGKIVEALAPAILLNGQEAFVTPSIGVTLYPSDSTSAENLLKNADLAMYRAKEEGGNGFRFFTPEMNTLAANRLELESDLRQRVGTCTRNPQEPLAAYQFPGNPLSEKKLFCPP